MQGAENVWRYDVDNNLVKTIQPLAVVGYEDYRFNWNAPIETSKNNHKFINNGLFGYLSYDSVRFFESIKKTKG